MDLKDIMDISFKFNIFLTSLWFLEMFYLSILLISIYNDKIKAIFGFTNTLLVL